MNKNAIQKYAIWARNELRNQITQRAFQYGITPEERPEKGLASVNGIMLTPIERKQRDQLIEEIWRKGFDQVIEELAYTWFNRLIAIRFMEVNDYLPEGVRVLSNSKNEFKPEILVNALSLDEDHFKKNLILRLIDEGKQEELYRYLLLAECNALNEILPVMFERMDGYTELVLPANLLKSDSVIGKLINDIDESDWKVTEPEDEDSGQVQIIGWLYQFYNSELKDETFAELKKKNKKISKERIPAATQLFTPEWIVKYMVENSLGRLWLEGHPNNTLKSSWKYYLDEAEQEPDVEEKIKELRREYSKLKPEDLTIADLAMGSGHILVTAFDVLMKIYRDQGYRDREAVKSILENNLFGLDIDDRASQLAYFSVMMKAREYDYRIFNRGIQPNLFAIQESNEISNETIEYVSGGDKKLENDLKKIVSEMKDAKEFGSIITTSKVDYHQLKASIKKQKDDYNPVLYDSLLRLESVINAAELLSRKYKVVAMNPPYLSGNNMDIKLSQRVKKCFPDSKSDMFSVFTERALSLTEPGLFTALITQHSWMFLTSYEKFRQKLLSSNLLMLNHLGPHAFDCINGEIVQTTCWISRNSKVPKYVSIYRKLTTGRSEEEKKELYLVNGNQYTTEEDLFQLIPGAPLAYWAPKELFNDFQQGLSLGTIAQPKQGMSTCNVDLFTKYWFEVCPSKTNIYTPGHSTKWIKYNKGGSYCRWYGNRDFIVNWEDNGSELINAGALLRNRDEYFNSFLGWSKISSSGIAFRQYESDFLFDGAGGSLFVKKMYSQDYLLGFLNSSVADYILSFISPTLNFNENHIGAIPVLKEDSDIQMVENYARMCVEIARDLWNEYETSWDFRSPELIINSDNERLISTAWNTYKANLNHRIDQLNDYERVLNKHFESLYHLEDSKELKSLGITTVERLDVRQAVVNLLSYFVGLIFGRFYKDEGAEKLNGYYPSGRSSLIDPDNIVPIGEDEYFNDDLVAHFIDWIKIIYGEDTLEENLQFIADALGGKGSSREIIRKYFLTDFYADHCKTYKKRPIYWLFDSGKKNGFKCLIYMHRYQPDTIARIRTDYVHEQQERYRSQIKHINDTIDEAPKSEQVKMRKQLKDLTGKLDEVTKYEEKIHHLADQMIKIDLDDGVKHNYALFQDVLAKIK